MIARWDCLEVQQMEELMENQLSRETERHLIDHIDECPKCQALMEKLSAGCKELAVLKQSTEQDTGTYGPAFFQAMERLKGESSEQEITVQLGPEEKELLGFLQESRNPELLGRFGRYEVFEMIGRGGMGILLKARDPLLDAIVAVKVLNPHLAPSATARMRFIREARAAAAITHNNVIRIHGVAERDGLSYLVMDFIPGKSLEERILEAEPLNLAEILRIGMQVALGVDAAHSQGVIHRDIKPGNILLENGLDRVKITDFGLAQVVDEEGLTQSGLIAGTPGYMSPEQAQEETVDYRSDLFSFGSLLYAMCTGAPPFRGKTSIAVIRRVCDEEPTPIHNLNPTIPDWLVDVIARLHRKNPDDRFKSAGEVADILRRHLAKIQHPGPVSPPGSSLPEIGSRKKRKRPAGTKAERKPNSRIRQWWRRATLIVRDFLNRFQAKS